MTRPVVVSHGLAIAVLLGYIWFVFQPITGGDVAIYSPLLGVFFVIGSWLIAAGLFAWARWGSLRGLLIGDLLGLLPPAFVAFLYQLVGLVLFAPIVVPVLAGLFLARGEPRGREARGSGPRPVHPLLLALLIVPFVVSWWYALSHSFDAFLFEYAFSEAVTGGVAAFAVLLWLDRRPGLLLGSGLATAYFGGSSLAVGISYAHPDSIAVGSLLLVSGLVAAWVAGRDVLERGARTAMASSLLVAATGGVAGLAVTLLATNLAMTVLAPLAVALAILVERPGPAEEPDWPEDPEATTPAASPVA